MHVATLTTKDSREDKSGQQQSVRTIAVYISVFQDTSSIGQNTNSISQDTSGISQILTV